jgi:transposase InsO family protein
MWRKNLASSHANRVICTLVSQEASMPGIEAKVSIEQWRREYNIVRPHSTKGYKPPTPEAIMLVATT